ncbi:MAG: hypothetical protein ACD_11C00024G0022 [uncultured bacterium]|nr:MAG: hypothetical protein ACD_11C00024G0022 [uncultured bacterium]HBR71944.1 hypothetical protein [Candidatus Moranbacteria bacterium]
MLNYALSLLFSVPGAIYVLIGFVVYAYAIWFSIIIIPENTRTCFVDAIRNDFCAKVFLGIVVVALFCCIAALLVIWPLPFILAICCSEPKYTSMLNTERKISSEIKQVA